MACMLWKVEARRRQSLSLMGGMSCEKCRVYTSPPALLMMNSVRHPEGIAAPGAPPSPPSPSPAPR
eukprot:CAMPEP_0173390028 /NCGR_PEP_ID=MMETSP1356-20130122/14254_1 /TAXON_ID=77927 ORGANISM="Hemiselmis virescens, Strain PCC157" /NCGR_SAMPLE_ID=MMETSP1356 /ASSEMBLY_ACC=CAM_ASM_000847 /LENGTH=65 /DNA_ID=CAMNT_0014347337 /DNA_START=344 /DNA_END=538 /DNA_ORIENTATION=-